MEIKTESVNTKSAQEFEKLLNEDFKKRDLKEGKIIKAVVSEISKKHVFVDLKAKAEGIIPIEQFKSSKGGGKSELLSIESLPFSQP